ncbi:MAG: T9SS type A sorting domain-containing protein [Balneola sp.]
MKVLLPLFIAVLGFTGVSAQNISDLNDEFDNSETLSNWSRYHEAEGWPDRMLNINIDSTEPGALFMEPTSSGWYNDLDSPFLFKMVSGDFIVTTRVKSTGKSFITPQRSYSLTGIFIREPRNITPETWTAGQENWMFISTGAGDELGVPKFEVKNTVNSQSVLHLSAADTGWIELRLERLNDIYTIEYRLSEGDWALLRIYEPPERPVMPEVLQIGLVTYTDWESFGHYVSNPFTYKTMVVEGQPDLYSYVDYIRFSRPGITSSEEKGNIKNFVLAQNYPNPFNPETRIDYTIPTGGHIEVNVFNVLGQNVESLVNSYQAAGLYSIRFKSNDIPTGTYYYQLKVNGQVVQTRKMMLLK